MVVVLTDADTGQEIVWFIRRGKPYFYLRDKETKRFIKRLKEIEVRCFQVVDYPIKRAKKSNPLYVDVVGITRITAEEWDYIEEVEEKLEDATFLRVSSMFGYAVSNTLLELSGYEYGSELRVSAKYRENRYCWVVMWKHKPEDKPRKLEGEDWL